MIPRLPHGGKNRDGHGKLERTAEIHHQDGSSPGGIAGHEPGQRGCAEGPWNQAVRQVGSLILCGGLELLGFLDHPYNAVIPSAAGYLAHRDRQLAFLDNRARIDHASRMLVDRERFPCNGGLIHHSVSIQHDAVKGNHVPGADEDRVIFPDLIDPGQDLLAILRPEPDLFHIQGHGPCQILYGLLVGPFFNDVPDSQQEHDTACGVEFTPQHGNSDGGRIQDRYLDLPGSDRLQGASDVGKALCDRDDSTDPGRKEEA